MSGRFWRATCAAAMLVLALPALAPAKTLVAKTNRGGSCKIDSWIAAQPKGLVVPVDFGVTATSCHSHFGIRRVQSFSVLRQDNHAVSAVRGQGKPPYSAEKNYPNGTPGADLRSVTQIAVVTRTRRSASTHRLERWHDPDKGNRCRVTTTFRSGDTLTCSLKDSP